MIGTACRSWHRAVEPHPTLHGSLGDLASIAATNARVLSAPFLLALFRFPDHRRTRRLGDLLIAGVLAANALRVGLALGRWQSASSPTCRSCRSNGWPPPSPRLPGWPSETGARRQTALAYLAAVLVLVIAAAGVETIATPHAALATSTPVEFGDHGTSFSGPNL